MVILYGVRPYFQTKKVVQHGFCHSCGKLARLKSFNANKFFHLYYIPIIPAGRRKRSHQLCNKCNTFREWMLDEFEAKSLQLKERSADAAVALQEGEEFFDYETQEGETPVPCIEYLQSAMYWLFAAGEAEFCEGLIRQLSGNPCKFANELLSGHLETSKGKFDSAINHFQSATLSDPASPQPLQFAGHLLVVRRRRDEAIAAYQSALAKMTETGQKLGLLLELIPLLESAKNYAKAVEAYDQMRELAPAMATDKKFQKVYQKLRKKAGLK